MLLHQTGDRMFHYRKMTIARFFNDNCFISMYKMTDNIDAYYAPFKMLKETEIKFILASPTFFDDIKNAINKSMSQLSNNGYILPLI